jgi:ABC-type lipoprotein export system ATPase subunit
VAEAAAMPLPDGTFDVVCCQQGLQFFTDPAAALREMRRTLRPGGRLAGAMWRDIDQQPVFAHLVQGLGRYAGAASSSAPEPLARLGRTPRTPVGAGSGPRAAHTALIVPLGVVVGLRRRQAGHAPAGHYRVPVTHARLLEPAPIRSGHRASRAVGEVWVVVESAAQTPLMQDLYGLADPGGGARRGAQPEELYRHVGFVFQDVQLLRASIRDNIALARSDAPDERIAEAARAAQIHERIQRLPRGHDSVVGEDAQLSAGEAQRVSIARALLADAPILVLDEATAFADPESEAAVQDALSTLVAGRTLLVIAHRLHTIVHADQILVLTEGQITERGRHEELLATEGTYVRMWAAQQRSAARDWAHEGTREGEEPR